MVDHSGNNRFPVAAVLPPLIPVLIITYVIYGWFIPDLRQKLFQERKQQSVYLTQSLVSAIDSLNGQVKEGSISLKGAQQEIVYLVMNIRFGVENRNYFWIQTDSDSVVVHPFFPQYTGKHKSEIDDPAFSIIFDFYPWEPPDADATFVEYQWQRFDNPDIRMNKVSYIMRYRPWGWIIGTGVYLDDLETEFNATVTQYTLVSFLSILLAGVVSGFIIYNNYRNRRRRRRLQAEKDSLNKRHESLFETSNDALILFDAEEATIVKVNRKALDMFKVERAEDAIGKTPLDFSPKVQPDKGISNYRIRFFFKSIVKRGQARIANWQLMNTKGETIDAQVSASLHKFDDRNYILLSIRDISDLIAYQHKLEELQIILEERLNQIQDLNNDLVTFDYSVNNSLLVPLRHILGYAEILDEDLRDQLPEKSKSHFANLMTSTLNLRKLIDSLQLLSKATKQKLKRGSIDLASVARTEIQKQNQNRSSLIELKGPSRLIAYADHTLMQIALSNLLDNSIQHSKGQKLIIELGQEADSDTFFYRDNVCTINEEDLDSVFKPFYAYHTSRTFEGTELGLATVARIIQRHGGSIEASTGSNAGISFTFTLPDTRVE